MNDILAEIGELLDSSKPDYQKIRKLSRKLSKLDPNYHNFEVDAKTLIHLGRDSIKDHTTALLELVKNSYDADAFNVDVNVFCTGPNDCIRVADNGFGMTREQIINYWLRIGFSSKRKSKVSELGRRKTGEKGIGRISTDRLGSKLELISLTENDGLAGLRINWDDFDADGKDVSDIEVEIFKPDTISIPHKDGKPSETGTEIKISDLRQKWNADNIQNLYYELSSLTSPFKQVDDFTISLENDVDQSFSRRVESDFYKAAEIDVTAIFDGTDTVFYSIKDKYTEREIIDTIDLKQFYTKSTSSSIGIEKLKSGPLEVKLLFFLRDNTSVLGTGLKLADLRDFLDNNNGVKIYRDNVAVKPYGFPKAQLGYDWLGLGDRKAKDPAGVGRTDAYRVSPYQLVGAVFISRDNNLDLLDSAAREGLVESEAFFDMKEFTLATLRLLESRRATLYADKVKEKEKGTLSKHRETENILFQLSSVKDNLSFFKDEIETKGSAVKAQSFIRPIEKTIAKVEAISEEVDSTISDLLNWQRVLSGLATMGISSAVFGHETENSIALFQGATKLASKYLGSSNPNVEKALKEIEKAMKFSKRVGSWGAYALTRVQQEKRKLRLVPLYKTIESVVSELKPAFEASSITIEMRGEPVNCRTYQMDIESVLVNLLSNAYTACLQKSNPRKVIVTLQNEERGNKKGFSFSVADSGPGVAKEYINRIFEPLFSTKKVGINESKSVGTGLGLTIVRSVVDELEGEIFVEIDKELSGAYFKIWLPKTK